MLQRPLTGEPLGLDLVNTGWVDRGRPSDLFDEPDGVESWLREHRFVAFDRTVLPAVEAALREARTAVRRRVRNGVVSHHVDVPEHWLPAWSAVVSYVELLADRPERLRRCAHPACVLYFYDTSRNGTRRWCSMDACGSRTKASRHYSRVRARGSAPS